MHAVGDRGDGDFGVVEARPEGGEHAAGHHAVQFGHAVGPLGKPQAHDGHVEHERVAVGEVLAPRSRPGHRDVRRQPASKKCWIWEISKRSIPAGTGVWVVKTVEARTGGQRLVPAQRPVAGHQFAGSARRPGTRRGPRSCGRPPARGAREPLELPQRLDPAHAEQELLLQPVVTAAAVEPVGDAAGGVVVARDVGVQQQQRHAPDVGPPDVRRAAPAVGQRKR